MRFSKLFGEKQPPAAAGNKIDKSICWLEDQANELKDDKKKNS